jgi:hypothetical protein
MWSPSEWQTLFIQPIRIADIERAKCVKRRQQGDELIGSGANLRFFAGSFQKTTTDCLFNISPRYRKITVFFRNAS